MSVTAQTVGINTFVDLVSRVSPAVSLCVRGRHAIGKSEAVYQGAARRMNPVTGKPGVPVVERRLSQMTEGDIIGLPVLDSTAEATQFKPCDWLIQACREPVVLFLDERNRALEGVKQAVFQLTDSKVFYGHRLHEGTLIVIAENVGDGYTVNSLDPAEVSRCATVELDPSENEWLEYADGRCNQLTVLFIKMNPNCLEHTAVFEPNKKYPDRRSWFKLDAEITTLGLWKQADTAFFRAIVGSFIGPEVGSKFVQFVQEQATRFSAEEILEDWPKTARRIANTNKVIPIDTMVEAVAKVSNFLTDNVGKVNKAQIGNLASFFLDLSPELFMALLAVTSNDLSIVPELNSKINSRLMQLIASEDFAATSEKSEETKAKIAKAAEEAKKESAAPAAKRGRKPAAK